jgi:hypothetical protein
MLHNSAVGETSVENLRKTVCRLSYIHMNDTVLQHNLRVKFYEEFKPKCADFLCHGDGLISLPNNANRLETCNKIKYLYIPIVRCLLLSV